MPNLLACLIILLKEFLTKADVCLLNVPSMYLFCTNVRKNLWKRIVGSEQILRVTLVEFIIADKENP